MAKTDKIISITFALFTVLVVTLVSLKPRENEPVLVLGNPFKSHINTISTIIKADGSLVNETPVSFAMIAASENPTFISQLYARGAWLVLSPRVLSSCFALSKQT